MFLPIMVTTLFNFEGAFEWHMQFKFVLTRADDAGRRLGHVTDVDTKGRDVE